MGTRIVGFLLAAIIVAALLSPMKSTAMPPEQVVGNKGKPAQYTKKYLPYRKYQALEGKVVGILAGDAQSVIGHEGRSGPPNHMGFSHDGCSYRWVYVPALGDGIITNLRVPVGNKGEKIVFNSLNMADPKTVKPYGVHNKFSLVEVEVNSGQGSPVNDSFVATSFKVLDGTEKYPLQVSKVIDELKKNYAQYCQAQKQQVDGELSKVQKEALQGKKPTGPRKQDDIMYVTWNRTDKSLEVRFISKVTDGHYYYTEGGAPIRPFPLPVRPIKKNKKIFPPPPQQGGAKPAPPAAAPPIQAAPAPVQAALPPPPPQRIKIKVGTTFGVEFGRIYTVSKEGKTSKTQDLPFHTFYSTSSPPPGIDGPRFPPQPVPLPVPPVKK